MSTSTGSEPRLRDSNRSLSERFFVVSDRLKRYHGELVLQLASVSDTMGQRISAPPDERRFKVFFCRLFFVFPLWQLLRFGDRLSDGTEPRRCCSADVTAVDDGLDGHKKSLAGMLVSTLSVATINWI